VRVCDDKGRELCASRELAEIDAALHAQKRTASATVARVEPEAWRRARAKWETPEHTTWVFGDVPDKVLVTEQAGVPVFAFPGFAAGRDGVGLVLFKTPEEARTATRRGLAALLERQLSHDLGWLERDLRALRELGALTATLAPLDELQAQAFGSIRRWVCDAERCRAGSPDPAGIDVGAERRGSATPPYNLTEAAFAGALEKAKADLRGLVPRFCDLLREILTLRQALLMHPTPPAGMDKELAALLPADFLAVTPYAQRAHFPRYLKAMKLRADRWRQNPAKDAERAALLAPYVAAVAKLSGVGRVPSPAKAARGEGTPPTSAETEAFRWLVEEFRVSLFAQELGTAEPVSVVKLDRTLGALQGGSGSAEAASAPARPIVTAPIAAKKSAPLKNLGALDKLFPR